MTTVPRTRRGARHGWARACIGGLTLALVTAGSALTPGEPPAVAAAACDGRRLSAVELNAVFSRPGVGATARTPGYAGGDYQHTYSLPDGRVLWLFQDMFFSNDDDLRDSLTVAAHNNGLVQDGECFRVLGPSATNLIGAAETVPLQRWFWPLDGEVGADGRLWVFVAEFSNPNGTGAGPGARPVATWVARLDTRTLRVVSFERAPLAGSDLYGYSVVSDDQWSYLYGWCYRQFTEGVTDGVGQFDPDCMPEVHVARVPRGRFGDRPQVWNGSGWVRRVDAARPISIRGSSNPPNVRRFGDTYVSVAKVDDWWGLWVHVDIAPTPVGPWEPADAIWTVGDRRCEGCGIYHAMTSRHLVRGRLLVSTSNGAEYSLWYRNAQLYRPSFRLVDRPRYDDHPGLRATTVASVAPVSVMSGTLRLGQVREVDLDVPAGTRGVQVIVTIEAPRFGVQVRGWACGARPPDAPSASARAARTTTTTSSVTVTSDGRLCLASTGTARVKVRVAGHLVAPRRYG